MLCFKHFGYATYCLPDTNNLKYTEMARDAYEQMILLAEKRYGLPIRKKCDAK